MKKYLVILFCLVALVVTSFVLWGCSFSSYPDGELPDASQSTDFEKPNENDTNIKPVIPDATPETPKPDETKPEIKEYTVTFIADGITVGVFVYCEGETCVEEPAVPQKTGYVGEWQEYCLTDSDITVYAEYTRLKLTVNFCDGDEVLYSYEIYYGDTPTEYPLLPVKKHFTAEWSEPVCNQTEIRIDAVYSPVDYSIKFIAEGIVTASLVYNVLDTDVSAPPVPNKPYYFGEWEEYCLDGGDKTVYAVYTPIVYSVEFFIDGQSCAVVSYTVENNGVTEPALPDRAGYTKRWSDYSPVGGNIRVDAIYSPMPATQGLKYRLSDGVYYVVECSHSDTTVVIPAEYNGLPVAGVYDEAFLGDTLLEELHICEGVKSIGYCAFYGCTSLKKAVLADSIYFMDDCVFQQCISLEEINIPKSLTKIPAYAFMRCPIMEITIPDNVAEICEYAFYLSGLESVTVGDGVKTIGAFAFFCCYNLQRGNLGAGLEKIGRNAFTSCESLVYLEFKDCNGWTANVTQQNVTELIASSPEEAAKALTLFGDFEYTKTVYNCCNYQNSMV